MIATVLSAIVFGAIFSAYLFMARKLTRLAYFQQMQVQNRRVLYVVGKDVGEAIQVTSALPASLGLTLPPRAPSPNPTFITYTYDPAAQTLTRLAVEGTGGTPTVLLKNLTAFTFTYFDQAGAVGPPTVFIKEIEFSYSSALGTNADISWRSTKSSDSVVSSRMVLRSKPPLGQ